MERITPASILHQLAGSPPVEAARMEAMAPRCALCGDRRRAQRFPGREAAESARAELLDEIERRVGYRPVLELVPASGGPARFR